MDEHGKRLENDLEHNSMDLDTAVQISVAALGAGIAPIVRVPAGQNRALRPDRNVLTICSMKSLSDSY
jgi:hypothetical protein